MRRALVLCVLLLAVACSDDGGGDDGAFCERMRSLGGSQAIATLALEDEGDVERALEELQAAEDLAPPEIAEDIGLMADWLERYQSAFQEGVRPTILPGLTAEEQMAELQAAADAFEGYLQDECGIDA